MDPQTSPDPESEFFHGAPDLSPKAPVETRTRRITDAHRTSIDNKIVQPTHRKGVQPLCYDSEGSIENMEDGIVGISVSL